MGTRTSLSPASTRSLGALTGAESLIVWCAFAAFGLVLVFVGVALKNPLLGALGVIGTGAVASAALVSHNRRRRAAVTDVSLAIKDDLKKHGLKRFSLEGSAAGLPAGSRVIREATQRVYADMFRKAVADCVVTEKEQHILDNLREKLGLSASCARKIEDRVRKVKYGAEVRERLADGELTDIEARELRRIRASLGLSDAHALQAARSDVVDAYRAMFRRFVEDGVLSDDELIELEKFREATGLSPSQAAQITERESFDLFRRTVSVICQDGDVTDNELEKLTSLRRILGLSDVEIEPLLAQVERMRELAGIRRGNLPTLRTGVNLRNSEICHFEAPCRFQWETPTQMKDADGRVLITNRRLIFQGDVKSFDVKIDRILDVIRYSNAIELQMTTRRGQGTYFVDEAELLDAVVGAVIQYHNRIVAERLDSTRSRHVPEQVRLEVWQRDGGKCARCGATDYLEFDHIIPFTKGGSNSAKNIQLLCRRCNLAKGDEIV